ncbi:FAD-dependent oxidoreductase [Parasphingorhabdus sp.]|uniref:FAD-dependent oxidoreductase n=1 Tax=Parasphingorhabdus sp. TaxID=2709688 RepID=UPI0030034131
MTDGLPDRQKPRLAIIGTGIAGLSAAYLLKSLYSVTVFEAHDRAGMGAHGVDYVSNGITRRIDIPLRIFCRGYYDHLLALYDHIGVEILASDHAGIFADETGRIVLHYGNRRRGALSVSYLKGRSLFSAKAWTIGLQSRRFFSRAKADVRGRTDLADTSFGAYLQQARAGQAFVDTVLLPMLSVTCTCDYQAIRNYPADIMLEYLTCGIHQIGIMSAANGVEDIVPRLLTGVELRTNSPVEKITADGDLLRLVTSSGADERFDHVVIAAQAQQAAAMLPGFGERAALLNRIPFERSSMSVHTDKAILPSPVEGLSPVSYHVPRGESRAEVSVDLTKAIARLSGQDAVFQTWNPMRRIAPNRELARVDFTRPTVTRDSRKAVTALRECQMQAGNRLWLCGSYMAEKIPLLEAAVESSVAVAERLGAVIPWKAGAGAAL